MSKENRTRSAASVWITASILALLAVVSFVILANTLWSLSSPDHNVIPLLSPENTDTRTDVELGNDGVGTLLVAIVNSDSASVETQATMSIFRSYYTDPSGNVVTVASGNGSSVIAPGTENDYSFSLKNISQYPVKFTLDFSGTIDGSDNAIPLQIKLKKGSDWLLGNDDEWVSPSSLNATKDNNALDAGSYCTYTLSWRWPYESAAGTALAAADKSDTQLGSASLSTGQSVDLALKMTVTTSIDEDKYAQEGASASGLDALTIVLTALAAAYLVILILILVKLRRRREDDDDQGGNA